MSPIGLNSLERGPLRDLGLRISRTYFNGLRAPKDKIAVLQGSIARSSGLQELYFLKFEKIAMGIVWAPGLQAFKMMGSRAPATPLSGPLETRMKVSSPNYYNFKKPSILAQTIRSSYNSAHFKNVFLKTLTAVWSIKVFLMPWYTYPVFKKYILT